MTAPTRRKVLRTERVRVEGAITLDELYPIVQRLVPDAPPDATIEVFVSIPGGGDWSNEDLSIDLSRHVQFTVEWSHSEEK